MAPTVPCADSKAVGLDWGTVIPFPQVSNTEVDTCALPGKRWGQWS